MAELDIDAPIDHLSLEAQGIELEPRSQIGAPAQRIEGEGIDAADRAEMHREIARNNGERIITDPNIALDAITHQQSTFTRRDMAKFAHRHSDGINQFNEVMGAMRGSHMLRIGAIQVDVDPLEAGINELQERSKTHEVISKTKTQTWHRILNHYLPLYFPEIAHFAGNSRSDWFLALIERFPIPTSITSPGREAFVAEAWSLVGRKVSSARLINDIFETACSSVALPKPRSFLCQLALIATLLSPVKFVSGRSTVGHRRRSDRDLQPPQRDAPQMSRLSNARRSLSQKKMFAQMRQAG